MNPKYLRIKSAELALDLLSVDCIVKICSDLIDDGYISSDLLDIFFLSISQEMEIKKCFVSVLDEFGVGVPNKRDAVICISRNIAEQIVEKDIDEIEGANQIWSLSLIVSCENFPDLHTFIYAASEWESRPEDRNIFINGIITAARQLVNS